jgi:3',5'-cyclic AMP phosphodiesterase CpdA
VKILHVSDLHVGKRDDESELTTRLVKKIIGQWGDDDGKPIIAITGDVVDDGRKKQYKEAKRLLQPLWDAGFSLVSVPGNHDYGWAGGYATAKKFKLFKKYLYGPHLRITYPQVAFWNDYTTLIGLNSMKAEVGLWDGLLADGEIGSRQLDELGELILDIREDHGDDHRIVVMLHHHPFLFPDDTGYKRFREWYGHRLKDGDDLMNILSGHIDVLLFGHEHRHVDFSKEFLDDRLTERYQIPVILCNGKTTNKALAARIITIAPGQPPQVDPAPWCEP